MLPELDLGIQNAIRRAYRLRKQPRPKDVLRIGKKWTPHASVASWYLWRSLEGPQPKKPAAKRRKAKKVAKKAVAKRRLAGKRRTVRKRR